MTKSQEWTLSKQQLEISAERRRQILGPDWKEKVAKPHRCNPQFLTLKTLSLPCGPETILVWQPK
jgi:hypothetical protein